MKFDIVSYNIERDRLQKALDAQKTSKERNMKGQCHSIHFGMQHNEKSEDFLSQKNCKFY